MTFDNHDIAILKHLKENSTISAGKLSKLLGISKPTVIARIKRLKELGIIRKFTIDINAEQLEQFTIIIKLKVASDDREKIQIELASMENVRECFALDDGTFFIKATFFNEKEYSNFSKKMLSNRNIEIISTGKIISSFKEEPRTIIDEKVGLILLCAYCKNNIRETKYIVTFEGRRYYVCCPVCKKMLTEKHEKLKAQMFRSAGNQLSQERRPTIS